MNYHLIAFCLIIAWFHYCCNFSCIMLTCYYCSAKFKVISELFYHYQYTCSNFSFTTSSRVRCGEFGCFQIFDSLRCLRMHLKRTHSAINKIIPITDAVIFDTNEAASALTYPKICNVSVNTSKMRIENKEIFEEIFEENNDINFEETAALDIILMIIIRL